MECVRAYLDIETTGCSRKYHELTVVGIAVEQADSIHVIQLVGDKITPAALQQALADTTVIYTYNGRRFDLPFIKNKLSIDLERQLRHRDLMYDCLKQKLKGGLKSVEQQLGIGRQSKGIDGLMAVRLWWDFVNHNDAAALETLLIYNREDIVNLKTLRLKLGVD